jgi:hypothetical protein
MKKSLSKSIKSSGAPKTMDKKLSSGAKGVKPKSMAKSMPAPKMACGDCSESDVAMGHKKLSMPGSMYKSRALEAAESMAQKESVGKYQESDE